jgi:hypothetical protein
MNRNARESQFRAYIVYSALCRPEFPLVELDAAYSIDVYIFLLECCLQNVTNVSMRVGRAASSRGVVIFAAERLD